MTGKRFTEIISTGIVIDNQTGKEYNCEMRIDDDLLKLFNQLSKENEQLKCGNQNLKAILNDFINICNKLQSNPNNQQTLGVVRDMLQNMGIDIIKE